MHNWGSRDFFVFFDFRDVITLNSDKENVNKFWNFKLKINLCVICWIKSLDYGRYVEREIFFIIKSVLVFVIHLSRGKMLGIHFSIDNLPNLY